MIFGYARVSTENQRLGRQIDNIFDKYPEAHIFKEKFTGTTTDRPEFSKLIKEAREGDKIVFDSISRMSRNSSEGVGLYKSLMENNIDLIFLKEPHINTEVIKRAIMKAHSFKLENDGNKLLKRTEEFIKDILLIQVEEQIEIVFNQSEKEVKDLQNRISEGMRKAKANGSRIGTEKGRTFETKKSIEMKEKIRKMSKKFDGVMKDKEVIEILRLSRNTYYKYVKEMNK
ncbi:hypothetical protein PM10SUCC1_32500 [Propionigenium maris DSM 9537]|uniref:Resolvase/invertase-type recombinase catalytic domain-containing protein n=1 Tax=Propionigenium maris DSM 9537 TaxID=1123000 RepID=A0A9W6LNU3_9FUSO|nr:recombinase family protein [Propionigenium maris]GLI57736.1 hypothetical protein PM10SUCC1_32500 [Propionigenium maris DSM 9537]